MAKDVFKAGYLHNETEAYDFLERLRWPAGPRCPHCGEGKVYRLKVRGSTRRVLKCAKCRKQFSVTVGTIFEDSHIPLTKWLMAIHLLCASKKGMSAHQLHRMLGITYKSAWFMAHRIRLAMTQFLPVDKLSGTVEADETFIGGRERGKGIGGSSNKTPVFTLLQRGGQVRSVVMPRVTSKNLKTVMRENVDRQAQIMTHSYSGYRKWVKQEFADHQTVNHRAKEYVRGSVHTNTVEGYFSLLKRGLFGTYHHVGERHLHRYLAEFDFRYNKRAITDGLRSILAMKGTEGKRLQYR